jgi:citrate lyase subunit beta/citryl-CoA lyase
MQGTPVSSYLFVPGNRPERFAKACSAGAGAVIVDLEDAVAPDEKVTARAAVGAWLSAQSPVLVRINSADTEWFRDDVEMCRRAGVAGIVLPKAERSEDIRYITSRVAVPVLPLIETAKGMWHAHEVACCNSIQRLIFGSIDFQVDLGIDGEDEQLLQFRSQLVLVSRVAGIQPPVDGVTTAIDDAERLRSDTLRGKRLGFGAKLCIHPKQVETVNACFRPSEEEVQWATRVVQAAGNANGAAVAVDGKMVDKPVLLRAEAILARSR